MQNNITVKSNPPPTFFGLLRHGITIWNEEKRIQGSGDSPLSAKGIEQTRQWADYLSQTNWELLLASDLGRVQQTVALLNQQLDLPIVWDERLREINWGEWEGMKLEDVRKKDLTEITAQTLAGWDFRAPCGESRKEALLRAKLSLKESAQRWPGKKILVVCHLGIIKCLLYDIMGKLFLPEEKKSVLKNGFHLLRSTGDSLVIDQLNRQPPNM